MTIGIVLSKPPRYSETFFISKIKGLQNGGHKVILFVQAQDKAFDLCPVEVALTSSKNPLKLLLNGLKFLFSYLSHPNKFNRFIKWERKTERGWNRAFKNCYLNAHILKADLDWLHFGFSTMAFQSENVAKAIGAKMAVSLRGYDIDVVPLKRKSEYQLIWDRVDKVHALSNYLIEKASQLGLKSDTTRQIISPAIDLSVLPNDLNYDNTGTLRILTIARLHWIKGLDYTLEALAQLKNEGLKFEYSIVGSGPEFERLKFAIYQLGLENEVNLVGGIPHTEVYKYLTNSDLYIQYSNSEGFCNALLEAQGHGLLCVASDGGALKENVLDSETGWIVPKRNPEGLAEKIKEIISLPREKKNEIIKNAQARVKRNFGLEKQQQEFISFYE